MILRLAVLAFARTKAKYAGRISHLHEVDLCPNINIAPPFPDRSLQNTRGRGPTLPVLSSNFVFFSEHALYPFRIRKAHLTSLQLSSPANFLPPSSILLSTARRLGCRDHRITFFFCALLSIHDYSALIPPSIGWSPDLVDRQKSFLRPAQIS